jgi:hypothetical protein
MRNPFHLSDIALHPAGLIQRCILHILDLHMRSKPDDFGFNLSAKSANNGEGQQERSDPNGDATDGDIRNETQETMPFFPPLRTQQVAKGYKSMK